MKFFTYVECRNSTPSTYAPPHSMFRASSVSSVSRHRFFLATATFLLYVAGAQGSQEQNLPSAQQGATERGGTPLPVIEAAREEAPTFGSDVPEDALTSAERAGHDVKDPGAPGAILMAPSIIPELGAPGPIPMAPSSIREPGAPGAIPMAPSINPEQGAPGAIPMAPSIIPELGAPGAIPKAPSIIPELGAPRAIPMAPSSTREPGAPGAIPMAPSIIPELGAPGAIPMVPLSIQEPGAPGGSPRAPSSVQEPVAPPDLPPESFPLPEPGVPATSGTDPYVVSLRRRSDLRFFCGGVLIGQRHVLTAAHCLDPSLPGVDPEPEVVVGSIELTLTSGPGIEVISTESVHFSPETPEGPSSLVILKLTDRVNNFVRLPDPNFRPQKGQKLTHIGWGRTAPRSSFSDVAQIAESSFLPKPACEQALGRKIAPLSLCIQGKGRTCIGDDGGPIVVKHKRRRDLLVGIIGRDHACGKQRASVHFAVAPLVEWINTIERTT